MYSGRTTFYFLPQHVESSTGLGQGEADLSYTTVHGGKPCYTVSGYPCIQCLVYYGDVVVPGLCVGICIEWPELANGVTCWKCPTPHRHQLRKRLTTVTECMQPIQNQNVQLVIIILACAILLHAYTLKLLFCSHK